MSNSTSPILTNPTIASPLPTNAYFHAHSYSHPAGHSSGHSSGHSGGHSSGHSHSSEYPLMHPNLEPARPSSKYDFIKIKVWLNEHYYILSRFLISRVLSVTRIPIRDSIRIALELKKTLVDRGVLEIQHSEFEEILFRLMETNGFGLKYTDCYKMMTTFHYHRVPFIIFIGGTGCTGKSYLATKLAERLNMPLVLQTDQVLDFMNEMTNSSNVRSLYTKFSDPEQLLKAYQEECRRVYTGVEVDISKCFNEGKSIIVEGSHINPILYLELLNTTATSGIPDSFSQAFSSSSFTLHPATTTTSTPSSTPDSSTTPTTAVSTTTTTTATIATTKPKRKGIIVPLILNVSDEKQHQLLMNNWLTPQFDTTDLFHPSLGNNTEEQAENLLNNFRVLQEYLCHYCPPFKVVEANIHSFSATLDTLHDIALQYITYAYESGVFS